MNSRPEINVIIGSYNTLIEICEVLMPLICLKTTMSLNLSATLGSIWEVRSAQLEQFLNPILRSLERNNIVDILSILGWQGVVLIEFLKDLHSPHNLITYLFLLELNKIWLCNSYLCNLLLYIYLAFFNLWILLDQIIYV